VVADSGSGTKSMKRTGSMRCESWHSLGLTASVREHVAEYPTGEWKCRSVLDAGRWGAGVSGM
jgi:hypothetical protein